MARSSASPEYDPQLTGPMFTLAMVPAASRRPGSSRSRSIPKV